MAFFREIERHCKDKMVVDFGAGTGILGVYAALKGAKEVWFVENQINLHETIAEVCAVNNVSNYNIVEDVSELPTHYFDVCVSETLGDVGIERNFTRIFSDLIAQNPGCVAIPDKINLYYSQLWLEEAEKEKRYIENFPVNLKISMLYPLPGLRPTRIDSAKLDNEVELFSLDLKDYPKDENLRKIIEVPHPADKNFMVFHWKAFSNGNEFVSNTPERDPSNFNHWCQLGFSIPKDETLGLRYDIQTGPFVLVGNPHQDFIDNPVEYDNQYYEPSPDQFVQAPQQEGIIKWTA